jgi:hypothetical protein
MFKITDGSIHFDLDKKECIDLELRLNVSSKGRTWSHIGDYLFEYGSGSSKAANSMTVEPFQYTFLCRLLEKRSWEDCRDL